MKDKFTGKDIELLNKKRGLKLLLSKDKVNIARALRYMRYENRLKQLQEELIKLQKWVKKNNEKIVFVYEGRDAAGKGGAIRRVTEHLNPREFKVVALPKPTDEERGQWYFQRYTSLLPRKGTMIFFDRSWYNRAIVEPVNKFCTQEEYEIFMNQVNDYERMITESGIRLIKLYFSISKNEQEKRFKDIIESPIKKWKFSAIDQKALELWEDYTDYKDNMFLKTNTSIAPWKIIRANKKTKARIEAIEYILGKIPYENKDLNIIKPVDYDV